MIQQRHLKLEQLSLQYNLINQIFRQGEYSFIIEAVGAKTVDEVNDVIKIYF